MFEAHSAGYLFAKELSTSRNWEYFGLLKRDIAVSTVEYKAENDLRYWKAHVAGIDSIPFVRERNRMGYIQNTFSARPPRDKVACMPTSSRAVHDVK